MTRTVEDCAILFDAMCDEDPEDAATSGNGAHITSAQAALSTTAHGDFFGSSSGSLGAGGTR